MSDGHRPLHVAGPGESGEPGTGLTRKPARRWRRTTLVALVSVLGLVVAAAVAGYSYVNHAASSVPRVRVAHLTAAGGGPSGAGQTFLLTGASFGPTGSSDRVPSPPDFSGLIALVHVNADGRSGGVVSIPPQAEVNIPGHGVQPLWNASRIGGPGLLVQTVEDLTGIPINHWARINFNQTSRVVDAIGGVTVTLTNTTTSFGHTFTAGPNHLTGLTSVFYARQTSLTEAGRVLRQQSLVRAILHKIVAGHLLTSPVTMVHVLNAITSAFTLDSTFTNAEIATLVRQFAAIGHDGIFVTAPSHTVGGQVFLDEPASSQLWQAIKQDSLAAFAAKYPDTVTPHAVS